MVRRVASKVRVTSAAAIGPGIAPIDLLQVKLLGVELAAIRILPAACAQIAFVGGVAAPFSQATPEPAHRTYGDFCDQLHQSSPCATPVKSAAQRVSTYGASCSTASRRPLKIAYHCMSASAISIKIISASTPVTTASSRWLKIRRCTSAIFAAGIWPAAILPASSFALERNPREGFASNIFW